MNDDRTLERDIASTYESSAPPREPDGLLDDVLLSTSQTRQRPGWLASIKEPPMRISQSLAVGSPTARVVAILAATLLIAIMVAGAGIAGSRLLAADGTIVVDHDGNGDYSTIAAAVDVAVDGDTILIRPGTYDESLLITEDITIKGDGDRESVVVELSGGIPPNLPASVTEISRELPSAFFFEDSHAVLENLTVRGDASRIVVSGGAPELRDLVLDGLGLVAGVDGSTVPTGLTIGDGSNATVADSVITATDVNFITGASPQFTGNEIRGGHLWMQGAGVDPIITDNVIADTARTGIDIWGGARPTVERNTIERTPTGIEIRDTGFGIPDVGTAPLVRENTITSSSISGIAVQAGAMATIDGNVLIDNPSGISLAGTDSSADGNNVSGGLVGIIVGRGSPSITSNSIEGASRRGISVGNGTSPTLTGNTICGSEVNLFIGDSAKPVLENNDVCPDAPAG